MQGWLPLYQAPGTSSMPCCTQRRAYVVALGSTATVAAARPSLVKNDRLFINALKEHSVSAVPCWGHLENLGTGPEAFGQHLPTSFLSRSDVALIRIDGLLRCVKLTFRPNDVG